MPLPTLFNLFLVIHVGAGATALASFWGAVIGAKGGKAHRMWGRVFTVALYTASGMALGMGALSLRWPLAMHPQLTDAALYRGLFGWMMIYLGLLAICMARYGRAMVANRRDHGINRRWPMIALQGATLAAALQCATQGVVLKQPLMIGVGVVGFATVLTYLRYLGRREVGPRDYLPQHLMAMLGTGIAAYTAFLSVGLIELFPARAFNPAIWAGPTIVGLGLMLFYLKRHAPPRAKRAGAFVEDGAT